MNIPETLLKERKRLEQRNIFNNRMIEHYTYSWVSNQKELIKINNAIDALRK